MPLKNIMFIMFALLCSNNTLVTATVIYQRTLIPPTEAHITFITRLLAMHKNPSTTSNILDPEIPQELKDLLIQQTPVTFLDYLTNIIVYLTRILAEQDSTSNFLESLPDAQATGKENLKSFIVGFLKCTKDTPQEIATLENLLDIARRNLELM